MLPPRVAINAYFAAHPQTGSGQYLQLLTDGLPRLTRRPQLRLFGSVRATAAMNELPVERLSTPFDLWAPLAKVWLEQVSFPRAARRWGAELAHVPYFAPPLQPSLPTVVTIHDLIPLIFPQYSAGMTARLYYRLAAAAAPEAAAILADSAATRRDILRRLPVEPERVRVVYLGLPEAWFLEPDPALVEAFLERRRLPRGYLLYLGGYDPRKNVPLLLRAYRRLAGPGTPPLVLVGRPPRRELGRLLWELEEERRLIATGPLSESEKPLLYRGALALVYPSLYEGFGLPPLEAMACGTPVVTTRVSSLPEVVGPAGLTCPALEDPLVEALRRLLGDAELRQELARRGRERARHFTRRATVEAVDRIYRAVAAAEPLPPQDSLGSWPAPQGQRVGAPEWEGP